MNKKVFSALLLGLSTSLSLQAQVTTIRGVVESIDTTSNTARVRTADKDFVISIYNSALSAPQARRSITTFEVPQSAIVSQADAPMRANCSELPVSIPELENLAEESPTMMDFLKKIPEGTLQGFTFITNTLSLHRGTRDAEGNGMVSAMWPRVLRTSADGKITVSFVCDPKNPTFGKVEIIHFDDASKEFKTLEFDFGHPVNGPAEEKITHNPGRCVSCHAGSEINGRVSLKPNWPEYFFWSDCQDDRGIQMYGSSDDNMGPDAFRNRIRINQTQDLSGCNNRTDRAMVDREKQNYLQFREMQKDNECFNSLPWKNAENMDPQDRQFYPYSNDAQRRENGLQNYARRTNARFTDIYSHLMAQRNANIIQNSSEYEKIKYFIAMEEAGCFDRDAERKLREVMPDFQINRNVEYPVSSNDYSIEAFAPLLNNYAKRIGMQNKDWTMEFLEEQSPNYNAVMFYGAGQGDAKIFNVTAGNILKEIGDTNPVMKDLVDQNISRGITEVFGESFSCIDDLGGAISPQRKRGNSELCQKLKEENDKHLARQEVRNITCEECTERQPATAPVDLGSAVERVMQQYTQDQINLGKSLVEAQGKGKCIMCHSAGANALPVQYQFVPHESDARQAQSLGVLRSKSPEFLDTIERRLITDRTMPPPPMGADLTPEEREAIRAYILSNVRQ